MQACPLWHTLYLSVQQHGKGWKVQKHICNAVRIYGKKEAGTGEHLNTFNQINKHNRNAAAPHGRLPHTKHKVKSRPGPLSSSNVVTPPFIPSEAPPWDSRPVSGAGVVHYHSLHRPRSVPTALGPAPLVTILILDLTNTNWWAWVR